MKNLMGRTAGRLTVTGRGHNGYWMCICACGKLCTVRGDNITGRRQLSCGCLKGHRASIYARPMAAHFWRDRIEITNDPTDIILLDDLAVMVCEYAAAKDHPVEDYPTPEDILFAMPEEINEHIIDDCVVGGRKRD